MDLVENQRLRRIPDLPEAELFSLFLPEQAEQDQGKRFARQVLEQAPERRLGWRIPPVIAEAETSEVDRNFASLEGGYSMG